MKKSIKNVIMIGMAAVLIGTSAVTFSYARVNTNSGRMPQASFSQEMQPFGQHDGMNGGNGSDSDSNNNSNGNQQTPPEMPSGDNQNSSGDSQQTPPEMPGGDSQSSSGDSQQAPPEMPNGDSQNSDETQDSTEAPDNKGTSVSTDASNETDAKMMPQGMDSGRGMTKNNVVIASLCYAFLALQLGIVLLIIVYLIMSKFNKISFNEVFKK